MIALVVSVFLDIFYHNNLVIISVEDSLLCHGEFTRETIILETYSYSGCLIIYLPLGNCECPPTLILGSPAAPPLAVYLYMICSITCI